MGMHYNQRKRGPCCWRKQQQLQTSVLLLRVGRCADSLAHNNPWFFFAKRYLALSPFGQDLLLLKVSFRFHGVSRSSYAALLPV